MKQIVGLGWDVGGGAQGVCRNSLEYSLSEMGISLYTVFKELRRWGLSEDKIHSVQCAYCKKCQPIWQVKQ